MRTVPKVIMLLTAAALFVFTGNAGAAVPSKTLGYDRGQVSFEGRTSVLSFLKMLAEQAEIEIYLAEQFDDYAKEIEFVRRPLGEVLSKLLKGYNYAVIYSENLILQKGVYSYTDSDIFDVVNGTKGVPFQKANKKKSSMAYQESGTTEVQAQQGPEKDASSRTDSPSAQESLPITSGGGTIGTSSAQKSVVYANINAGQTFSDSETEATESDETTETAADTGSDTDSGVKTDSAQDDSSQKIAQLEYQIQKLEQEIASGKADEFLAFWSAKKDSKYVYDARADLENKQQQLEKLRGY